MELVRGEEEDSCRGRGALKRDNPRLQGRKWRIDGGGNRVGGRSRFWALERRKEERSFLWWLRRLDRLVPCADGTEMEETLPAGAGNEGEGLHVAGELVDRRGCGVGQVQVFGEVVFESGHEEAFSALA